MEGTERQVEWAEKIKQGIKREAEEYLQEMKNRQKAAEELSGFDAIADLRWSLKQYGLEKADAGKVIIAFEQQFIPWLEKQDSASWWIDNKSTHIRATYAGWLNKKAKRA
jgi:hypothetical protein